MGVPACISLRWVEERGSINQVLAPVIQVTAIFSSVFMTGRVKNLEEFQYKASVQSSELVNIDTHYIGAPGLLL
jgi:hypothetical protein